MASLAAARLLPAAQKRLKADVNAVYKRGADGIRTLLLSYAPDGGAIRKRDERAVVRAAGDIIMGLFVGPDGRSPFADDGVTALAPFPAVINGHLAIIQAQAARVHQRWLEKTLPEDVLRWLQGARPPQDSLEDLTEQRRADDVLDAAYRRRVLAAYDRAHTFVDPNGYVLSDRIWRTGVATRSRIDAILAEGIRQGTGALDLARLLEQFLLPSRAALRTRRPYGTDASFDGMRLARTELTAAFGRTTILSAQLNPYVTQIAWRLSASHPRIDICDALAAAGPYAPDKVPSYPPHPQCVTPGQLVMVFGGTKPIENITADDIVLTHTGEYCLVDYLISRTYVGPVIEIATDDTRLELTPNHPVMTADGWVKADDLKSGARVRCARPDTPWEMDYSTVREIRRRDYDGPVYNIAVDDDHSYTVGGVVVHNCLCTLIPGVGDIRAITGALRAALERGDDAPFTPAAGDSFLVYLLGAALFRLVQQWEAQEAQTV